MPEKMQEMGTLESELDFATEEKDEHKKNKKERKRKKGIYRMLVKQLEFYFSDANLRQSKFLTSLYNQDPWIKLSIFLTFNKVASMLKDILGENADDLAKITELQKALQFVKSDSIILSECNTLVSRKHPFTSVSASNVDKCTLYVENLPLDADHDYVRNNFSSYGTVLYVSLPKFKSGKSKGFAFVEFDSPDIVDKIVSNMTEVSVNTAGDLASIKTFNEEKEIGEKNLNSKKRKIVDFEGDQTIPKRVKVESSLSDVELRSDRTDIVKKESNELLVLSKIKWKKLRNQYLNEQWKNYSALKQNLKRNRSNMPEDRDTQKAVESKDVLKSNSKLPSGLIIKLNIPGGVDNVQTLKHKIKNMLNGESVAYVDAKIGLEEAFIRCADLDQAKRFNKESSNEWKSCIITGEEETKYFQKIERDKSDKRSGKVKVKKIPKKTKLVQKTELLNNSHVYFDQ